jgi:DNA-binding MarR family transcriptional regulator
MLDRFDRFTSAIFSIHRSIQKIQRQEMAKYGLKGAATQYLLAMARHPEGITAATLCEVCHRDKAGVSRTLSQMEDQGLIRRAGGDTPYRALLTLTDTGAQIARSVSQKAATAVALAGKELDEDRRQDFYRILQILETQLDALSDRGLPDEI